MADQVANIANVCNRTMDLPLVHQSPMKNNKPTPGVLLAEYDLNQKKAVANKIAAAHRDDIKYEKTMGGDVVYFSAGTYTEVAKAMQTFYQKHPVFFATNRKNIASGGNAIVDEMFSVINRKTKKKAYVVSMYNTKSKALVNGKELDIFYEHLVKILSEMINWTMVDQINRGLKLAERMLSEQEIEQSSAGENDLTTAEEQENKPKTSDESKVAVRKGTRQRMLTSKMLDLKATQQRPPNNAVPPKAKTGTIPKTDHANHPKHKDPVDRDCNRPAESEVAADSDTHPCGVCHSPATTNAVKCDICKKWLHYRCQRLTDSEITQVKTTGWAYTCSDCCHNNSYTGSLHGKDEDLACTQEDGHGTVCSLCNRPVCVIGETLNDTERQLLMSGEYTCQACKFLMEERKDGASVRPTGASTTNADTIPVDLQHVNTTTIDLTVDPQVEILTTRHTTLPQQAPQQVGPPATQQVESQQIKSPNSLRKSPPQTELKETHENNSAVDTIQMPAGNASSTMPAKQSLIQEQTKAKEKDKTLKNKERTLKAREELLRKKELEMSDTTDKMVIQQMLLEDYERKLNSKDSEIRLLKMKIHAMPTADVGTEPGQTTQAKPCCQGNCRNDIQERPCCATRANSSMEGNHNQAATCHIVQLIASYTSTQNYILQETVKLSQQVQELMSKLKTMNSKLIRQPQKPPQHMPENKQSTSCHLLQPQTLTMSACSKHGNGHQSEQTASLKCTNGAVVCTSTCSSYKPPPLIKEPCWQYLNATTGPSEQPLELHHNMDNQGPQPWPNSDVVGPCCNAAPCRGDQAQDKRSIIQTNGNKIGTNPTNFESNAIWQAPLNHTSGAHGNSQSTVKTASGKNKHVLKPCNQSHPLNGLEDYSLCNDLPDGEKHVHVHIRQAPQNHTSGTHGNSQPTVKTAPGNNEHVLKVKPCNQSHPLTGLEDYSLRNNLPEGEKNVHIGQAPQNHTSETHGNSQSTVKAVPSNTEHVLKSGPGQAFKGRTYYRRTYTAKRFQKASKKGPSPANTVTGRDHLKEQLQRPQKGSQKVARKGEAIPSQHFLGQGLHPQKPPDLELPRSTWTT